METKTKMVPLDLNSSDIQFTLFFSSMKITFLAQKKHEIQIYLNLTAQGALRFTPRQIRDMKLMHKDFTDFISKIKQQTLTYLN